MASRVDSAATDFSNPVVHHDAYDFWIHFFEWAVQELPEGPKEEFKEVMCQNW